jgi:hypothetical protein
MNKEDKKVNAVQQQQKWQLAQEKETGRVQCQQELQ